MDELDDQLREIFYQRVLEVYSRDSIYSDQVAALQQQSRLLRRLTVIEVLADVGTTWDRLDNRHAAVCCYVSSSSMI
jgi:hypothetical protein